ncbi:MAG TPA: carbohydrate kinase family protein [Planctomycetota bacterium]|jgi:sugar/nucleoside kinase (ribokinase family)
MRHGIIASGNWIVDSVKTIDTLPAAGACATVYTVERSGGGAPHNVLVDLACLKADLPLWAHGAIGDDEGGLFLRRRLVTHGVDTSHLRTTPQAPTSFADVMNARDTNARTFFHFAGANALLAPAAFEDIGVSARIFHLGYLLLLPLLDAPDPQFQTGAARALASLTHQGYKTSVDVISSACGDYRLVLPSLPHTDYLIVNEIEAGGVVGAALRRADGALDWQAVVAAARSLRDAGVREVVVIHFPEGAHALAADGHEATVSSFRVPPQEIQGTVGAGDAFCAGMLFALHEGMGLQECLRFANANARFNLLSSTSTDGARPLAEVLRYLEADQSRRTP